MSSAQFRGIFDQHVDLIWIYPLAPAYRAAFAFGLWARVLASECDGDLGFLDQDFAAGVLAVFVRVGPMFVEGAPVVFGLGIFVEVQDTEAEAPSQCYGDDEKSAKY